MSAPTPDPRQAVIFEPLDPPVRAPSPDPPADGAAGWSRLPRDRRGRCDECARLQMADPAAPVARAPRWRRVHGAHDWLLCDGHAAPWRQRDHDAAEAAERAAHVARGGAR